MSLTKNYPYNMKLHEVVTISHGYFRRGLLIIRVPGGWLYQSNVLQPAVFVPYSKEFWTGAMRKHDNEGG
jgi:hypothetical protein